MTQGRQATEGRVLIRAITSAFSCYGTRGYSASGGPRAKRIGANEVLSPHSGSESGLVSDFEDGALTASFGSGWQVTTGNGGIDPGSLLALRGKPVRAAQYAIGNPLLAIQMIEHAPEAAL
jgi:hypothetical protein